MTRTILTSEDVGKRVLASDGTEIGRVVDVREGRAYVDRDPALLVTIRAKLGWGVGTERAHPLDEGSVAEVTADAIRLRGTL